MIPVIINERSGVMVAGGSRALQQLAAEFEEAGVQADVRALGGDALLEAIHQAAASEDVEVMFVGGGDGTIGLAAGLCADTGKTLGILPMGTLNVFARDLGIPLEPPRAARALLHGRAVDVDCADLNGTVYLCNAILGLMPPLIQQRERLRGRRWVEVWRGMLRASWKLLRWHPKVHVRLRMNGEEMSLTVRGISVSNNAYHDSYALFPSQVPLDRGTLAVYIATSRSRWDTFRLAVKLIVGNWHHERDLQEHHAREVTIHARRNRLEPVTDGELLRLPPPLHFRIRPRALRVLVPVETADQLDAGTRGEDAMETEH